MRPALVFLLAFSACAQAPSVVCSVTPAICTSTNEVALPQSPTNWMLAHIPDLTDPANLPVGTLNGKPIIVGRDSLNPGPVHLPLQLRTQFVAGRHGGVHVPVQAVTIRLPYRRRLIRARSYQRNALKRLIALPLFGATLCGKSALDILPVNRSESIDCRAPKSPRRVPTA